MSMRHRFVDSMVARTRPYVRRLAELYGIRLNYPCEPTGQHPLVIEDSSRAGIPASVLFNTRSGRITIGRGTVFGEDVHVLTGKHLAVWEAESSGQPLHFVPEGGRDIEIGRNCYIGSGAILIGPIVVHDHAVIGAGSVVTHDVPARSFVAGVPARLIRTFTETADSSANAPSGDR